MNRNFYNFFKSLFLGVIIYWLLSYLLSFVLGNAVLLIHGIILTTIILFCTFSIIDAIRNSK